MKNKLVVIDDVKNPIKPSPGFQKKELSDYHLDLCGLCGFGCSYCSSNHGNNLRIHREHLAELTEQQLGVRVLPSDDPALMFVYPDVLKALRDQLARHPADFGMGKTLVVSMLTDAFSPELIKGGITEEALRLVLDHTKFRIRILTKCSIVGTPRWIEFFLRHPGRFVVGLSIGTLDDAWAHEVEKGTSRPTARLRALRALQDAGVPTFGMACPIFPDVLEGAGLDRLVELARPKLVEHFWAEPFNDRLNWQKVRDGYGVGTHGYRWLTETYEHRRLDLWSAYATEFYTRLRTMAANEGWLHKLRYLLYERDITAPDATRFAGLDGVLLQSNKTAEGTTRNESLRQWDTHSATPEEAFVEPSDGVAANSTATEALHSSPVRERDESVDPRSSAVAPTRSPRQMRRPLPISAFSQDEPEQTRWLWTDRIPLEALTAIQGDGGGGKSTLLRWIAARVTRGDLPGDFSDPANVLWLNIEEHAGRDIRPGLDRQGADVERVYRPSDGAPIVRLPLHLERLHDTVVTLGARLVVIDQVNAFIATSHEGAIRSAMTGLRQISEDCACAIVISRNLNGSKSADAYRRGRGGGLLVDICRANFHLGLHPDDAGDVTGRRVLVSTKGNIYGATSRAVVIGTDAAGRIVVGDELDLGANELLERQLDRREQRPAQLELAIAFLRELLEGREVPTQEAERASEERGFSARTFSRARARLDVLHRRVTNRNPDGSSTQQTLLRLPSFEPPTEPQAPGATPNPSPLDGAGRPSTIPDDASLRFGLIELDDLGRLDRLGKPQATNGQATTLPTLPPEPAVAS